MYLMKAKKEFETKDQKELDTKKQDYKETQQKIRHIHAGRRTSSILFKGTSRKSSLDKDHLPKGFSSNLVCEPGAKIKPAGFIGTFSVESNNASERAEIVRRELGKMRNNDFHKKVLIMISELGIKIYSPDGSDVLMSHELARISYTTSDPEFCQFCFLAREPHGKINVQFCHVFITTTPQQSQELASLLGQAFSSSGNKSQASTVDTQLQEQFDSQRTAFTNYRRISAAEFVKRFSLAGTENATPNLKAEGGYALSGSKKAPFTSKTDLTGKSSPFSKKGGFMSNNSNNNSSHLVSDWDDEYSSGSVRSFSRENEALQFGNGFYINFSSPTSAIDLNRSPVVYPESGDASVNMGAMNNESETQKFELHLPSI